MYTPGAYAADDGALLHQLMREWSFATLISCGADGLAATQLPFLLDVDAEGRLRLVTHMARANPQWRHFEAGVAALVVFQGPHAFVSPSWYENQRTFPTWNYGAIHAHGVPVLRQEPGALRGILDRVVATYDTPLGGPWRLDAIPEEMIAPRLGAIVGLEIPVTRLEGKLKFNQDKSAADRAGVIAALEAQEDVMARETARFMRRLGGEVR